MKRLLGAFALMSAALLCGQVTPTTPGWTEFDIPGLEAPMGTVVDMSFLNTEPAGAHGFARVVNGHFVDDRNIPLRLYGTNLTGDACFPKVEDGKKLAKRLRQYGFNCLRLHFMDGAWNGLFKDNKTGELDETKLRQLDAFIANCINEGIWCNVNLHVARTYPGTPKDFTMGKHVDRWHEPFIKMQEQYARDLMGRVNTVTGLRYADTPGILCVEINNENTMLSDSREKILAMPQHFIDSHEGLWTAWLKRKYGSDQALKTAWEAHHKPLGEPVASMLTHKWRKETHGGAQATLTRIDDQTIRWQTTQRGNADWHLQLHLQPFKLEHTYYTVSFEARSASSSNLYHSIMLAADPWQTLGMVSKVKLTPEWKTYTIYDLIAQPHNDANHRASFHVANTLADIEIRNYTIRPGGGTSIFKNQSVDTRIHITTGPMQLTDYFQFLLETEMNTTRRLANLLRHELKCRMPIADSQVNYGGLGGAFRENELSDFIDIHYYWEHPAYSKDSKGQKTIFSITNTPQVAHAKGGCLGSVAPWRIDGKPFSVSEYNAPAPNDHSADMFPLYSIYASIQNWDAFYSYTYRDFGQDFDNTHIRGYFQLIGRANLLAHLPFATLLYRQQLMPAAPEKAVLEIPRSRVVELLSSRTSSAALINKLGGDTAAAFSKRLALRFVDDPQVTAPRLVGAPAQPLVDDAGVFVSADGSYRTQPKDPNGAWATLNLPNARMVTGSIGGRSFDVGDLNVSIAARDWPHANKPAFACITLITLDGKPLSQSRKMLLAASARTENCHAKWNDKRTTLVNDGTRYGRWGTKPVMSELVPATFRFPFAGQLKVTVLNAQGQPASTRTVPADNVSISADDNSLWFLLER